MDSDQSVQILDLGNKSFQQTWELQKRLHSERVAGKIEDTLILVEHEPVYTIGRNADRANLLPDHPKDVNIYQVERGGDITYHGPGQLVGYPIMDLHNYRLSVSWYIHSLEEVLIRTLADFGIVGERRPKYIGVWVNDEKVAALGVRLSRWVSMHGFALNVDTDLKYFNSIVPCGMAQFGVTTMSSLLKCEISIDEVKPILINHFLGLFEIITLDISNTF